MKILADSQKVIAVAVNDAPIEATTDLVPAKDERSNRRAAKREARAETLTRAAPKVTSAPKAKAVKAAKAKNEPSRRAGNSARAVRSS